MSKPIVLEVRGLCVRGPRGQSVLDDVELTLRAGEVTALVGETGSGKTTVLNSVLGLLPPGLEVSSGEVWIEAGGRVDLLSLSEREMRRFLGLQIGYVPQDIRSGLNPLMTARAAVLETASRARGAAKERANAAMRKAGLGEDFVRHDADRRPHKLSGGQCQRVLFAQAIVNQPRVLLLDEPTASLDPPTRREVQATIRRMAGDECASAWSRTTSPRSPAWLIRSVSCTSAGSSRAGRPRMCCGTHDILTLALYSPAYRASTSAPGSSPSRASLPPAPTWCLAAVFILVVSFAKTDAALRNPSSEKLASPERRPVMSSASTSHDVALASAGIVFSRPAAADQRAFELRVDNLAVRPGEVLALCGPSGSGKSTLVTIIAGLLRPQSGQVLLTADRGSIELYGCSPGEWRRHRRHFGFVYQDPREYLNDRRMVVDIVADPLHIHKLPGVPVQARAPRARLPFLRGLGSRRERRARAFLALQKVGITQTQAERKPSSLSGGQRQRVAIARALMAEPRVVILDEPTSALDVSVQASIVDLLRKLRQDNVQAAFVLVTHDLPLARQLADRVAILDQGRIVELGDVDQIFQQPASPITRKLIGIARAEQAGLGK